MGLPRWIALLGAGVALTSGAACAGADPDESVEDTETTSAALDPAGKLTVVQYNPYYAGKWQKWAFAAESKKNLPETYETMETFAAMLDDKYAQASVIGMQEIATQAEADEVVTRLRTYNPSWQVKHYAAADEESTGSAILWREDEIGFVEDFGTKELRTYYKRSNKQPVSLRFGGALLFMKNTDRSFGFFTGKLTPRYQLGPSGGTLEDSPHKVAEVARLQGWIKAKMSGFPYATRIVAVDLNADYGSSPWKRFNAQFEDADDQTVTWQEPKKPGTWHRFDYIWWDIDAGTKRKNGFFGEPEVMGGTGSDHRAVIADVYVRRAAPEAEKGKACDVTCCNGAAFRVHAGSEKQCRKLWTVCRDNDYTAAIAFNGAQIYEKNSPSCGG